jgi:hypothetical protein
MKIFSFCLYGSYTRKYYQGLLDNLEIIRTAFPDWKVVVYVGTDVPISFRTSLQTYPFCIVIPVSTTGPSLMLYRFCAIDNPDVKVMCVRDADSRIHERDQWTIRAFLQSPYLVHILRDHSFHTMPIVGGMWGMKRGALPVPMTQLLKERFSGSAKFNDDQLFLQDVIYPKIKHVALVHASNSYRASAEETIVKIPFPVSNKDFIGQVIEYMPPLNVPFRKCEL